MTQPCDNDVSDFPRDTQDRDSSAVTPDQLKVVVVDDAELMRRLVHRALTSFGFTQIFVAENGAEGVALAWRCDAPRHEGRRETTHR